MVRRFFGRGRRGRGAALGALMIGAALVVSACSSQPTVIVTVTTTSGGAPVTVPTLSSGAPQSASSQQRPTTGAANTTGQTTKPTSAAPVKVRVSANPAFGTKKMAPNDPITVTVFNAELQKVTLLGDDGSSISGKITNDKHTWVKSERLKYGTTYTLTGTAKAADGTTKTIDGRFTTVKPTKTMPAYINIPDGETVGIAAPIIITFAGVVKDRAAAEKMLKVTINGGKRIVGSWGWMQDEDILGHGVKQSRVHFRPKDYWPANATVKVLANLYGVDYGSAWGREDMVRQFKIGPRLIIKTDVPDHRLLVIKNDQVFRNYPVAYGVPATQDEGRTTVSGVHVVMEKKPGAFTMCNPKYGYCGVTEYWGVRINNNGEFIHANTKVEKEGLLGKANVSHGCINMSMHDAKELFHMVYFGVPVDVEGTGVHMSYSDYIWDWGVSYATWKTFSAL